MILAVDVDYGETSAIAAGILFHHWTDPEPDAIYTSRISQIHDYVPGSFYKRELPCILSLLNEHHLKPEIIVVDGFVYLDGKEKPGLGKHLYDALEKKTVVIGVAKTPFKDIGKEYALYRGESSKPLYVTAEGMDLDQAIKAISGMFGNFRMPELLKRADQVCRGKC